MKKSSIQLIMKEILPMLESLEHIVICLFEVSKCDSFEQSLFKTKPRQLQFDMERLGTSVC